MPLFYNSSKPLFSAISKFGYNIYILLRRIYLSDSYLFHKLNTYPIGTLYHLYTKSMDIKGYLGGSFGVPRGILRPTQGAGSLLPRSSIGVAMPFPYPSLAQKGCLSEAGAKHLRGTVWQLLASGEAIKPYY